MAALTKQQIGQRWDTLPEVLREALVSETNSNIVWSICEAQNISDKKIHIIAGEVAATLMGFLHVDDTAEAFKTDAGIDAKTAVVLQDAFNKKIFIPLKPVIDSVYKPMDEARIKTSVIPNPNAPKMFDVANPASAAPVTPAVPLPPKQDFSRKGWSEIRPAAMPSIPAPSPARIVPAAPNIPKPTVLPQPPKTQTAEPAPVILGGTNFTGAPQKNSDFRLSKTGGGAQIEFDQAKPQAKIMPAMIEFSRPAQGSSPTLATSATIAPAFKPMPVANSGPRSVTEITSDIPKPPAAAVTPATPPVPVPQASQPLQPPQPPKPPTPPAPPAATPQVKVITKNFP